MKAFGELVKHVRSFSFFIITILIFSYYFYIFIFTFLLSSNGRKCSLKTLQRRLMQRYENMLKKGFLKIITLFLKNDLTFLRIRTKKHEIMIWPGKRMPQSCCTNTEFTYTDSEFLIMVLMQVTSP